MGDVMSDSGLASRDNRVVLHAAGLADAAGGGDDLWLSGGSEYDGWEDGDKDRTRSELSGLVVGFVR